MNIQTIYDYSKLATLSYVDVSAVADPFDIGALVDVARRDSAPGSTARLPESLANQMFRPGDLGSDGQAIQADTTGQWKLLDPYFKKSDETGHSDPASEP